MIIALITDAQIDRVITLLAMLVPSIVAYLAWKQGQQNAVTARETKAKVGELEHNTNSIRTELVAARSGQAMAEGQLKGAADEQARAALLPPVHPGPTVTIPLSTVPLDTVPVIAAMTDDQIEAAVETQKQTASVPPKE